MVIAFFRILRSALSMLRSLQCLPYFLDIATEASLYDLSLRYSISTDCSKSLNTDCMAPSVLLNVSDFTISLNGGLPWCSSGIMFDNGQESSSSPCPVGEWS